MSQKHTHWCSECYCEWLHDDSTCAAQRVLACPPCEDGAAGPEWVDDLRQVDDFDFMAPESKPQPEPGPPPEPTLLDTVAGAFADLVEMPRHAWRAVRGQLTEEPSNAEARGSHPVDDGVGDLIAAFFGGLFKLLGCLLGLALVIGVVSLIAGLSVHTLLAILVVGVLLALLGSC